MGSTVLCIAALTFAAMVCGATVPPANPASEKWQAPRDAAAKTNPESQNRVAIVHGRKLSFTPVPDATKKMAAGRTVERPTYVAPRCRAKAMVPCSGR